MNLIYVVIPKKSGYVLEIVSCQYMCKQELMNFCLSIISKKKGG